MKVARFWHRAVAQVTGKTGRPWGIVRWGWSADSADDARRQAERAAEQTERRWASANQEFHSAWYGPSSYFAMPPREEVLQEIHDSSGTLTGIVTRNSYGVLVLNTDRLLMVDVDRERDGTLGVVNFLWQTLSSLVFGSSPKAAQSPEDTLEVIRQAVRKTGETFRVYETAGGWRCLMTSRSVAGYDAPADRVLNLFPVDPFYAQLCKRQNTFRARLSPKPWRCGIAKLRCTFPRDARAQERFEAWEVKYLEAIRGYRTCRLLFTEGTIQVSTDAALRQLVELHDRLAGIDQDRPLA